ncbi:hypothetical protein D3C80_1990520 [compost metagenome]
MGDGFNERLDYVGTERETVTIEGGAAKRASRVHLWAIGDLKHAPEPDSLITYALLRILITLAQLRQSFEVRRRKGKTIVSYEQ